MNCTEFETALERAIETREPLAPSLLEHSAICATCRRLLETQQQLDAAIVVWKAAQPQVDFADAVLAQLAQPALGQELEELDITEIPNTPATRAKVLQESNRPTRSSHWAIVAAAACMVIATFLTARLALNDQPQTADTQRVHPVEQAQADVPDVSSTLTVVLSDLQSEYREMATETSALAREMAAAIPQSVDISTVPGTDTLDLRPNRGDMVRILEPIGSGVESALGFLWQAVPSEIPSG